MCFMMDYMCITGPTPHSHVYKGVLPPLLPRSIPIIQSMSTPRCNYTPTYDRDGVLVPRVRGRDIELVIYSVCSRTILAAFKNVPTSFRCPSCTNDEGSDKYDCVKAVSNGAFCLVTDKPERDGWRYHWTRRRAVLAFEVPP